MGGPMVGGVFIFIHGVNVKGSYDPSDDCSIGKSCYQDLFAYNHVIEDSFYSIYWNFLGKEPKWCDIFPQDKGMVCFSWKDNSNQKVINDPNFWFQMC